MRLGIARAGTLLVGTLAVSSCGLPPMISDTGYRGTWRRGSDRAESIVAITESDGRWYFRWTKRSLDGRLTVSCDWDGRCEERMDGNRIATYTITTRYDAAQRTLATETVEERAGLKPRTLRYGDVLEVADGGLTLISITTDRDGAHFDGDARPRRSFSKVADSVADPPHPERPR